MGVHGYDRRYGGGLRQQGGAVAFGARPLLWDCICVDEMMADMGSADTPQDTVGTTLASPQCMLDTYISSSGVVFGEYVCSQCYHSDNSGREVLVS